MGKTSYENMFDLSKKLNKKVVEIENGKLGLTDLEGVVQNARELYERLLILKHKAYEQIENPLVEQKVEEKKVIEEEIKDSIDIKIEEEEPSLDFSGITETESNGDEDEIGFDFSASTEAVSDDEESPEDPVAEVEKFESKIVEEEQIIDEITSDKDDLYKGSHVEKHEPEGENTLNEKLKDEDELSLRKQLQNTAVTDIKSEISIAKKFEYITFMFNGKNESYNEAIEVLNNCTDGKDARIKLDEYASKFNWNLDNKSIIKFVELVERRYL